MTKGNPDWEKFEHKVQSLLDLHSTPGSGNQWHAPSDGVSRPEDPYKIMVDCKHTQRTSYTLNLPMLNLWHDQATMLGFHFALPVHMVGLGAEQAKTRQKEWVVITLDDYAELVDLARKYIRSAVDLGEALKSLVDEDIDDSGTPWIPDASERDALRDDLNMALAADARLLAHHFQVDAANRCNVRHTHTLSAPCCRKPGHFGNHDNGEIEWA